MSKVGYIGIDTSNYTTSVALCSEDGEVIANLKAPLPVKSGEVGLRQSDAVFAHIKNLPSLFDSMREYTRDIDVAAVGVSATPRQANGSYMPCFLSGVAAANAYASAIGVPIVRTAHQNGHIMAALYSCGESDKLLRDRFLALHVSGGTTEALLVTPTEDDLDTALVGYSKDINAGQAIDRVGVMLGLDFPCGRELEALAASFDGRLEKKKITVQDGCCNLSGVQNHAEKIYKQSQNREMTAAFVFDFLCRTLSEMCRQLLQKHGNMPVLFSGGVMSNKIMRDELRAACSCGAYFSAPEYSADNAAGVALLCRRRMLNNK